MKLCIIIDLDYIIFVIIIVGDFNSWPRGWGRHNISREISEHLPDISLLYFSNFQSQPSTPRLSVSLSYALPLLLIYYKHLSIFNSYDSIRHTFLSTLRFTQIWLTDRKLGYKQVITEYIDRQSTNKSHITHNTSNNQWHIIYKEVSGH